MNTLPNPWLVPLLTVPQAAEALGVSRQTVYRAMERGELDTLTIGRKRVRVSDLYRWVGLEVPQRPGPPPTT